MSRQRLRSLAACLAVALIASGAAAAPAPVIEGLDHAPVAVNDLDKAAADFERLGFVIKPGRAHDDGISNRHVKFPNGGGIELITAHDPTDDLARQYADWLKGGDGPSLWSLYGPDLPALAHALTAAGYQATNQGDVVSAPAAEATIRLFFADRLRSPTDGPNYWAHPNTAYKLAAVWLAADPGKMRLLLKLGARRGGAPACAPFDSHAAAYVLPVEGDAVMLTSRIVRTPSHTMVGLSVLVRSLAAARRVLTANGVPVIEPKACGRHSLWIAPEQAHGVWLELSDRRQGAPER